MNARTNNCLIKSKCYAHIKDNDPNVHLEYKDELCEIGRLADCPLKVLDALGQAYSESESESEPENAPEAKIPKLSKPMNTRGRIKMKSFEVDGVKLVCLYKNEEYCDVAWLGQNYKIDEFAGVANFEIMSKALYFTKADNEYVKELINQFTVYLNEHGVTSAKGKKFFLVNGKLLSKPKNDIKVNADKVKDIEVAANASVEEKAANSGAHDEQVNQVKDSVPLSVDTVSSDNQNESEHKMKDELAPSTSDNQNVNETVTNSSSFPMMLDQPLPEQQDSGRLIPIDKNTAVLGELPNEKCSLPVESSSSTVELGPSSDQSPTGEVFSGGDKMAPNGTNTEGQLCEEMKVALEVQIKATSELVPHSIVTISSRNEDDNDDEVESKIEADSTSEQKPTESVNQIEQIVEFPTPPSSIASSGNNQSDSEDILEEKVLDEQTNMHQESSPLSDATCTSANQNSNETVINSSSFTSMTNGPSLEKQDLDLDCSILANKSTADPNELLISDSSLSVASTSSTVKVGTRSYQSPVGVVLSGGLMMATNSTGTNGDGQCTSKLDNTVDSPPMPLLANEAAMEKLEEEKVSLEKKSNSTNEMNKKGNGTRKMIPFKMNWLKTKFSKHQHFQHYKSFVPQNQDGKTSQNGQCEVVGNLPTLVTKENSTSNANADTIAVSVAQGSVSLVGPSVSSNKVVQDGHNYQIPPVTQATIPRSASHTGSYSTEMSLDQFESPTQIDSQNQLHSESHHNEYYMLDMKSLLQYPQEDLLEMWEVVNPQNDLFNILLQDNGELFQPLKQVKSCPKSIEVPVGIGLSNEITELQSNASNPLIATQRLSQSVSILSPPRVFIGDKSTQHGHSILCQPSSSTSIDGHVSRQLKRSAIEMLAPPPTRTPNHKKPRNYSTTTTTSHPCGSMNIQPNPAGMFDYHHTGHYVQVPVVAAIPIPPPRVEEQFLIVDGDEEIFMQSVSR